MRFELFLRSTVSAVLEISLPWLYLTSMCNLTALPPDRPAAKQHNSGTTAVLKRCRTATPAPPQRTKVSQIRYLCAPNCGIFSDAGTEWPRLASFFGMKPLQTWPTHHENLRILATWLMHNFLIPKFYLGLPFSPPGQPWPLIPVSQRNLGTVIHGPWPTHKS